MFTATDKDVSVSSSPAFLYCKVARLNILEHDPAEFIAHFPASFVDSTGTINLLAGIPLGGLDLVRPLPLCRDCSDTNPVVG